MKAPAETLITPRADRFLMRPLTTTFASIIVRLVAMIIASALLTASVSAGPIVYVDASAPAPAGGDGSSWASSLKHLRDAIDLAANPVNGITEIRVAQGVYVADRTAAQPLGSRDRNATFTLRNGVAMRGGYHGMAALPKDNPDSRDIDAFTTVLTGDLNGDDGPVGDFLNNTENAYQVVVAVNVDAGAILEGFNVRGGRADGVSLGPTPDSRDQGSAVNIYFGGPRIVRCTFEQNWAFNHGTINDHGDNAQVSQCVFRHNYSQQFGAGLYVHDHSATLATECVFEHNTALTDGAGAYCRSETGAIFSQCVFIGNQANRGGGLYGDPDSMPMISNCSFTENMGEKGAGMYHDANHPTIIDCTFTANEAIIGGAGIYNHFNDAQISGCTFTTNAAAFGDPSGGGGGGGSGGAGVWNSGGQPLVTDCIFTSNFASFGSGVYNIDGTTASIADCTFTSNLASEGAGLYTLESEITVERCSFTDNHVEGGSFPVGGGVSTYFSDMTMRRCTFVRNTSELGGGGLYTEGANATITNCIFHGNVALGETAGWGGGMMVTFAANPTITNCEFVGNVARHGGAIHHTVFTTARVVNCTIVDNLAVGNTLPLGLGGGVFNNEETFTEYANCIVWGNQPDQIAGASMSQTYSNIQGGLTRAGNINATPLFARLPSIGPDQAWGTNDDDYGDLRVALTSPCIDAGSNLAVPGWVMTDLASSPRFVDLASIPDTGLPDGVNPLVDMGARETALPLCAADIAPLGPPAGDGVVNVQDLLAVVSHWNQSGLPGFTPGDATLNGHVNVGDLLAVIQAWGGCRSR